MSGGVGVGRVRLVHLIILHIFNAIDIDLVTTMVLSIDKSEGNGKGIQLL